MLSKQLRRMFGFDIWQKLKHPQNPNLTNFNSDNYDPRPSNAWVGRIFVPKSIARKDPVSQYKNEAIRIVFDFLNNKHDYDKVKNDTWFTHNIKLDKEIEEISNNICEEMILKDHQFRHALEKNNRKKLFEKYMLSKKNNLKSITVQEFIFEIARICEESVGQCRKSREELPVYETENLQQDIEMYLQSIEINKQNNQ